MLQQVIKIRRLPGATDLPLPSYQTEEAAGIDLYAALNGPLTLLPGERALIPTGVVLVLPPGLEGQLRPRSGLALKHGLTILNSPGTVDSDYRGEIKALMINLGSEAVTLNRGDRIIQCVISAVTRAILEETEELPVTNRGEGGFGHTGR